MPGADAQDRSRFLQTAKAREAEQQLRELVALPVHRELVVRKHLELTQEPQPVRVVPLGGIGQLAQLDVAWQVAALLRGKALVSLGKFSGHDEHANDFPARLAGRERARVVREALGVGRPPEKKLVRSRDERRIGSQPAQTCLVRDRILPDADVVGPSAEDDVKLRRGQELRDDRAAAALREVGELREHLVVRRRTAKDDPERVADGRLSGRDVR